MRQLRYAYHRGEECFVSQLGVGGDFAWPILEYEKVGQDGDYTKPFEYKLEKVALREVGREYPQLVFTRYVPVEVKNLHRKFWGFKPLPDEPPAGSLPELCKRHKNRFYYYTPATPLVGIRHKGWGKGAPSLYYWFKSTESGYLFAGITDELGEGDVKIDLRLVPAEPTYLQRTS